MVAGTAFADDWLGGVAYDGISIVVTVLVLLFALGAHPARARAVAGGAAVLCVVVADELTGHEGNAMDAPLVAILCALPWTAGWLVRRHREQAAQLAELARQLEQERDANARLAVLAERTHMARELHDTVAHGVSVMVVQAAAAEQTSHQDTTVAREAINAVTRTGRDTLANLQQLLGLFELDDQPAPHGSPPTLAEIDELIAQMRDAGLPITLRVEGTPRAIRPEVAGCAFRIVREALTNVLKHAGTPPTAVVVRYRPGTLDLSIDNEGPGVTEAPNRAGHGLVGMRERTALVGGELQTGPRAAGGYSVHARLPLDGGAR
jgi:signal transduction histidine kinase